MVTHIVDTACIVCRTGCMKRVTVGPSVCSTIWPQLQHVVPSVLWRCWLDGRKSIRPVKNRVVVCWCGCLSGARCRLADSQPLPLTVSWFSKIQILVPAHLGSPRKRAVKWVCVCVQHVVEVCAECWVGRRHWLTVTAARCPAAVASQHGAAARCSVAKMRAVSCWQLTS